MSLDKRKQAFIALGTFLNQFTIDGIVEQNDIPFNDLFLPIFKTQIKRAKEYNSWFTDDNILFSLQNWSKALTKANINKWLKPYDIKEVENPKTIAIIMAGNIPLVGFHDFLSVAITGNHILAKLSSNDKYFIPLIAKYLEHVAPSFKGRFTFTEDKMENFDAVIATGSNNTARYFDYYFGKHPNIIRKSRNGVAILTGKETHEELEALSDDVFRYFGLGCRSISKIFVPIDYDFDVLFRAVYKHKDIINYAKYANNYDYNKAVYLMSLFKLKENGFLMFKEDPSYSSPIASLFYEYYDSIDQISDKVEKDKDLIQCVSTQLNIENAIPLGQTQTPQLWDYADNVDTIKFIINR